MGGYTSKSVTIYETKQIFWTAYYEKTRDYSVGPLTTVYNDESVNRLKVF